MKELNFCAGGGYLVGLSHPLCADPSEFYRKECPEILGCTRLRCNICGAEVRIEAGWEPESMKPRHYACDCTTWEGSWDEKLTKPLADESDEYSLPWGCAGHPVVSLPFELDGVAIAANSDWDGLVRQAIAHPPVQARLFERQQAAAWALKLYLHLSGTGLEAKIPPAVARLARDTDPWLRGSVLCFFERCWYLPAASVIEDLVEEEHYLFKGVPDPDTDTRGAACPSKAGAGHGPNSRTG